MNNSIVLRTIACFFLILKHNIITPHSRTLTQYDTYHIVAKSLALPLVMRRLSAPPGASAQSVFTSIYQNGIWGAPWYSGGGSELEYTRSYINFLQNFIKEHNITTVVDIGCGDWLFSRHINWKNIEYFGYDVVPGIIEINQRNYSKPNIHFAYGDALVDEFPAADLMVCKDVLQHLTNEDVQLFLDKHPRKYKYCLITNDVDPKTLSSANPNINRGGHRFIDITQPPFSHPGTKYLYLIP